ncbi:unnamed protein product [Protopolystoma xenopodis]|uniref:Uncharacterized protein n=1 Tax=Protopolystoma xenopodis TaxID=117903 RepID=A0A448WCI9_9PLAT|nr:unnamed protein product [Protopolystoma xenopodis]
MQSSLTRNVERLLHTGPLCLAESAPPGLSRQLPWRQTHGRNPISGQLMTVAGKAEGRADTSKFSCSFPAKIAQLELIRSVLPDNPSRPFPPKARQRLPTSLEITSSPKVTDNCDYRMISPFAHSHS